MLRRPEEVAPADPRLISSAVRRPPKSGDEASAHRFEEWSADMTADVPF
jgi:hypothetical protein